MTRKLNKELFPFLISTICFIPFALSINYFSWQFRLVSGGFPGYALVVNYLTGFSVGTFLLLINTIVLIANFLFVGKTQGLKGVYGYVFLSLIIDFTRKAANLTQFNSTNLVFNIFSLSAQGLIGGIAIGIIIGLGYSFGSYSSLVLLINKFWKITSPAFFFLMDFILAIITSYFFGIQRGILLLINAVIFYFAFKYTLKCLKFLKRAYSDVSSD